jgi:DNA-binding LytR/AlgR family response regulator
MKALHFYVLTFEKGDLHMNAALENRNVVEDFVLEKDILYYRTGSHGLVSFHGKNFNVRRRLSTEQLQKIIAEGTFYKVNNDCYVNIMKIQTIKDSRVYFESHNPDAKCVPVSRLKHFRLKELLDHQPIHN